MDARPASWSPPADSSRAAVAAVAAAAVFAAAWAGIHYGFYADNHIVDTPVYQRYGDAIADGGVPYRDFTVANDRCTTCFHQAECGTGCRGYAYLVKGDWLKTDPRCSKTDPASEEEPPPRACRRQARRPPPSARS